MKMANNIVHPMEMGLGLERFSRMVILSSDLQVFFETKQ